MGETMETVQYVGMSETSFTDPAAPDPEKPNGQYEPLVMEGVNEEQRNTADLRNEVLLELAANNQDNNSTIEHVQATAAVERAKERRKILIVMHRITQILLYILPTLIVLCLILYWTIEDGKLKWLTMVAAILGVTCVIDFILFQYFTNRVEGTDLLNTVARFRARLHKSGRRF